MMLFKGLCIFLSAFTSFNWMVNFRNYSWKHRYYGTKTSFKLSVGGVLIVELPFVLCASMYINPTV